MMQDPTNDAAIDLTEFRLSWRILLLAFFGIAISINAILLYGFGTLVIPFEEAFAWDRSALQIAITFLYGGAVVGLQAVGWFNQRFGIKQVTIASLVLMALAYLAATYIIGGSIWTLYITFAILPVVGMGALAVTWSQLLSLWYSRNRGLALAIGLSSSGLTAALTPTLFSWGIETWDWRAAFVILAALNFILIPMTLLWFKTPTSDLNDNGNVDDAELKKNADLAIQQSLGLSFKQGLSSHKFWICNLSLSLVVSAVIGIITNAIPILRDMGFTPAQAAEIFGFFGISLIVGRLMVGYFLDRLWPPGVAAISLLLPTIGCFLFFQGSNSYAVMVLALSLVGFGAGAEFDIAAFMIAKYFGLKDYGRLFGLHQALVTVAVALSPLLFATLFSKTGSYNAMLMYCIACTIIGPLLLLFLGKVPIFTLVTKTENAVAN